jgi:hypothetical protein
MPFHDGRFIAPRKPVKKQDNPPLLVLWLAIRLISAEFRSAGGDWDAVISTFRQLLGERPDKRVDHYGDGTKVTYATMARDIRSWRDEHRAH